MSIDDTIIETPDGPITFAEWKKTHPVQIPSRRTKGKSFPTRSNGGRTNNGLGPGSYPIRIPASAADIRFARLPAASARRPSLAIIGRWFGASPPVTAIWIAIEENWRNRTVRT